MVIFNEGLCKVAEQYLKKGAKVYIEGQLQTRKWTDQAGVEKYSTEVVLQGFNSTLTMLDGRSGGGGRAAVISEPTRAAAILASAVRRARRRAAPRWRPGEWWAQHATWTTISRSDRDPASCLRSAAAVPAWFNSPRRRGLPIAPGRAWACSRVPYAIDRRSSWVAGDRRRLIMSLPAAMRARGGVWRLVAGPARRSPPAFRRCADGIRLSRASAAISSKMFQGAAAPYPVVA